MTLTDQTDQQMRTATKLARMGEVHRAQTIFTQIVEVDPENVQAWLWLSELTDDIQEQTGYLEQALKFIPEDGDGRKDLQAHLNEIRGLTPASSSAQPGTPKKLNHAEIFQQAERLTINGKRAEALERIKKLIDAESPDERVWLLYSDLAPGLEEKIEAYARVVALNADNAVAHSRLEQLRQARSNPLAAGEFLELWGEYDQALALYQTIAEQGRSVEEQQQARNHILRLQASHPALHNSHSAPTGIRKVLSQLLRLGKSR